MFWDVLRQVMESELDAELGYKKSQRTSETAVENEPRIIGKYRRNADGMEEKILGMYASGMSQRDISEQIKSLYDVDISPELVGKISELHWTRA